MQPKTIDVPLTSVEIKLLADLVAAERATTVPNGAMRAKWTRILEKLDHA
jgi:hypothetical protein